MFYPFRGTLVCIDELPRNTGDYFEGSQLLFLFVNFVRVSYNSIENDLALNSGK